ncbi:MAG: hypothetical protein ACI9KN_000953 [Gammaproteobacteria bacterium]|jgi:hypothetical protein
MLNDIEAGRTVWETDYSELWLFQPVTLAKNFSLSGLVNYTLGFSFPAHFRCRLLDDLSPVIKEDEELMQQAIRWSAIAQQYGADFIAGKGLLETLEGAAFARQASIQFPGYDDKDSSLDTNSTKNR